jgi:hypothetical protein
LILLGNLAKAVTLEDIKSWAGMILFDLHGLFIVNTTIAPPRPAADMNRHVYTFRYDITFIPRPREWVMEREETYLITAKITAGTSFTISPGFSTNFTLMHIPTQRQLSSHQIRMFPDKNISNEPRRKEDIPSH